jgi:hypothetical protein
VQVIFVLKRLGGHCSFLYLVANVFLYFFFDVVGTILFTIFIYKIIYLNMKKQLINEAKRLQELAGIKNETGNGTSNDFGFWFRAGVRGEKQAQQAKDLLTQKGIDFNDEGRFAIDFQGKNLDKEEIIQLLRDNNITKFVVYNHQQEPSGIEEVLNSFLDTNEGGYMREYIDSIAEEEGLDLSYKNDFDEAFEKALQQLQSENIYPELDFDAIVANKDSFWK